MLAKAQTVIQWMEQLAPRHLAVPEDRIGLQLGTLHKETRKVMVALDVTEQVADEAVREGVDVIVAHHAIIYRPLKHLQTDTAAGRVYEKLIKHNIAVYIAHTNYDAAEGGMNDLMAAALGLQEIRGFAEIDNGSSGAGDASPGLGRIGNLAESATLKVLADRTKHAFDIPCVRVVGDLQRRVRRIAVIGGSGGRYCTSAIFAGADVLITGDIDYHTAQDALADGLALIDPGHNAEKIMKAAVCEYLQSRMDEKKYSTEVIYSRVDTEPFQFLT